MNASSSSTPRRCRVSRPARSGLRWTAPRRMPRSSAFSMPTTSSIPTGSGDLVPAFADPRVGLVQAPQEHRDGDLLDHALHHERRICRLLRHRHGPAQRDQCHHRARHHVPDPPRRDGHGRRLVERHDLRGQRPRPCDPGARLDHPLHQPPLRPGPASRHPTRRSRSSGIAGPMAASRS